VFNSEYDSFWCCTGTGVEEYSKANEPIYFEDAQGIYVNLFIASELITSKSGLTLRQQTRFPEEDVTMILVDLAPARETTIRVRVPSWTASGGSATLNGKPLAAFASPGSYLAITRVWKPGDRIDIRLPMQFRLEPMADDPSLAAVMYGPLVMTAAFAPVEVDQHQRDQELKMQPLIETPRLATTNFRPDGGSPLTFRAGELSFAPLYKRMRERYTVYFRV
jgi:DUF1680 family protein